MTIDVHTYGSVTPSFQTLVTEILENISKDMQEFPPRCNLNLCKTEKDFENLDKHEKDKMSKIWGGPVCEASLNPEIIGAYYLFDYPEIFLVENSYRPHIKSLEQLEGDIAHEAGHAADYYKYGKIGYFMEPSLMTFCIEKMKNEFEAENNALNAGYYSGLLARNAEGYSRNIIFKEPVDFRGFFANLSVIAPYAAFMQNSNPPVIQKRKMKSLFNGFAKSRSNQGRILYQSKELVEHPEKFGDKSFLEDFIFQKHYGWNFSFI
jgi:hypothetical protein